VVENDAHEQDPSPVIPSGINVKRILLTENLGTTASINHALAISDSSYVLLLNNDVELDRFFLENLLAALQADSEIGFAAPKLLKATNRSRLDGAGDALILGGGAYRLGHSDLDKGQFNASASVLAGCGAATMYCRAMIVEAGGLDEDFFAYLEDLDLSLRAQLLGWSGVYVPSAVAYHIGSATLGDATHPRIIRFLTRNQLLLIIKNYPVSLLFRLGLRILVFQTLWLGLSVKRRALSAYLKGSFDFLLLLPRTLLKRRELMRRRKITTADFLRRLLSSEAQIAAWHSSQHPQERSRLLEAYFKIFGQPKESTVS
jgi:GT2 family glycosyltransferase